MTMNVWGVRGDWPARREVLRATLAELRPDVLTLQETVVRPGLDQVAEILDGVVDPVHVVHGRHREPDGQGISTASRWPLTTVGEIDQQTGPRTAGFAATTLLTDVATPDGPVLVVNHFPSWRLDLEHERCVQTARAAREIERLRPDLADPVIVAGDLDADPTADSIRFWTGRCALEGTSVCYRDAWEAARPGEPGTTYTSENPLMDEDWPFGRIDYVLVRCGEHGGARLRVRDCRLVLDAPRDGVQASDHYGVLADLGEP
ncbi:endonuclease/exonuclease/phosphatase family protein [Pseudonocardia sp. CA-107938]|uniref:endonuclease/exonuclease/phosphatase family protein n=1 Tax=Pseudonocardia sp. CA-107938 TaxID=3240021 RepID=UPI003D9287C2